jgi:hypothetical protein
MASVNIGSFYEASVKQLNNSLLNNNLTIDPDSIKRYPNSSEKEYRDLKSIANSDLNLFRDHPYVYYAVKHEGKESPITSTSFKIGSMVDAFLLDKDNFDKDYVLKPNIVKEPGHPNQKKFLEEIQARILPRYSIENKIEVDKMMNYILPGDDVTELGYIYSLCYATKTMKPNQVNAKAKVLFSDLKAYLLWYTHIKGREIYSGREDYLLKTIERTVLANNSTRNLIFNPYSKAFNQMRISWKYKEFPKLTFKMSADRLTIDANEKKIRLVDLKTTSSAIKDYPISFNKWGYINQMIHYLMGIEAFKINAKGKLDGYTTYPYHVVVTTTNDIIAKAFAILDFKDNIYKYRNTIEDLNWHYENKIWHRTRDEVEYGAARL